MINAQLKKELLAYSVSIGIDKIGFASADPFTTLKERLIKQRELGYQSGFEESDIEKRVDPSLTLPKAQTIISIAVAYPSKMKNPPKSTKEERRGIFCRASWGMDYHDVLRERLGKVEEFIKAKVPDAKTVSMVDTGVLSDRAVAERAGIGWSAKNCAIITPEFGSYVYLGNIITTVAIEPDTPITDQCGSCTKCIDACPTGALIQGGQLDSQKCVAFLTQTKGFIADEYRKKIGNRLYGCDTCQQVCPKNKGIDEHRHPELEPDPEIAKPKLIPLLTMSNREFKEKFGHVSGAWRGKKPIQRNAILALGHFKDKNALPVLKKLLKEDPRPVIRGTAAWAIGKIGHVEGEIWLKTAKEKEKDEQVLVEIEKGLNLLENTNFTDGNQMNV
ncbi:iron-sulfur cluster-binding protein [Alkalihalobacillus alcalophilus ATCC 27647 = CGMCC 1.3604]|uniref:Iron-sulfur cluster-binding protein n=1 Tax=Alkalihalobacillus alcalophilus ATCC 27647 = CGMCC 1.3604 TaxID=1218173 RepID=A0A4S4JXW1_ALKAL|nr:tRNA epoxyqueuosine(34) reductase QueG [Alkalihalobacillus alcalophilus]MED1561079.1 tRNA epoxyqueuosine(34) reductase QueG [Alkalihalobacillus alcalophilus]THG90085.1 iron-sulfur cluster-binding protein [Alkalihalobacillus alcalophilus ATCC 27647 = CGMCC 1.3604]